MVRPSTPSYASTHLRVHTRLSGISATGTRHIIPPPILFSSSQRLVMLPISLEGGVLYVTYNWSQLPVSPDANYLNIPILNCAGPMVAPDNQLPLYTLVHISRLLVSPSLPEVVRVPLESFLSLGKLSSNIEHQPPSTKPSSDLKAQPPSLTRHRTRIACASCRAAGKKCSNMRPCERCVTRGIETSCADAQVSGKGLRSFGGTAHVEAGAGNQNLRLLTDNITVHDVSTHGHGMLNTLKPSRTVKTNTTQDQSIVPACSSSSCYPDGNATAANMTIFQGMLYEPFNVLEGRGMMDDNMASI
ncbi:hypothetical protein C8Q76DRAFT_726412 [Earliella scabrosa]|nr:hypothetical protein C8Q76DRAFT_726412 [Earliella scabrosa]